MKILIVILLLFACLQGHSRSTILFGTYTAEGTLHKSNRQLFFILNQDTLVKIQVNLGKYESRYKYNIGTAVLLKFNISKKCIYECVGKLLKIERTLEPYAYIKSF